MPKPSSDAMTGHRVPNGFGNDESQPRLTGVNNIGGIDHVAIDDDSTGTGLHASSKRRRKTLWRRDLVVSREHGDFPLVSTPAWSLSSRHMRWCWSKAEFYAVVRRAILGAQ